jgi:hypothetical protein
MGTPTKNELPLFVGPVPPDWIPRGTWLSEAAYQFADPATIARCQEQEERFAALRHGETPQAFVVTSSSSGDVLDQELLPQLQGDELTTFLMYRSIQSQMRLDLNRRLDSGIGIVGFGRKDSPAGPLEWIPSEAWFHMRIEAGPGNIVRGEGVVYWQVKIVDVDRHTAPKSIHTATMPAKRRGPPAQKLQEIIAAMLVDLREAKETKQSLEAMKQEALAAVYGASRETVVKARAVALSEFPG